MKKNCKKFQMIAHYLFYLSLNFQVYSTLNKGVINFNVDPPWYFKVYKRLI